MTRERFEAIEHGRMDIQIVPWQGNPEPNIYDLWVNGKLLINGESFTVCDQVRESLLAGKYQGETGEVAQRIADAVKGN